MSTCSGTRDYEKDQYSFQNFVKNLGKVFVITTIVVLSMTLRDKLVDRNSSLFYIALFILGCTFLFTMISVVDHYIFSNIMLGIGLALGFQMARLPDLNAAGLMST